MTVYKITWSDKEAGTLVDWARSKKDVAKVKEYIRWGYRDRGDSAHFQGGWRVSKHIVQPNKEGLIVFLRRHIQTDND
tara:strand:- start:17712 stop:17945 length:234 start_codon:yes stop_codon:yes gene_type:complete